jgi:hypothetical protein
MVDLRHAAPESVQPVRKLLARGFADTSRISAHRAARKLGARIALSDAMLQPRRDHLELVRQWKMQIGNLSHGLHRVAGRVVFSDRGPEKESGNSASERCIR